MTDSASKHDNASPCLPYFLQESRDGENAAPAVFLHGFGGNRQGWSNIQVALSSRLNSYAFDIPGHGEALNWPEIGSSNASANAVIASLNHLGLRQVHLVGHSLGGAIASLLALKDPERVLSLTLVAPGGFGPEINHKLLRRYAAAGTEQEMEILLEQFFGWGFRLPKFLARSAAETRRPEGSIEALQKTLEGFMKGEEQNCLDTHALADLRCPIKVIWGTQDRVLPTRQAHKLPGMIASHIFERVGHMPHLEAPREVARLILQNAGHTGK